MVRLPFGSNQKQKIVIHILQVPCLAFCNKWDCVRSPPCMVHRWAGAGASQAGGRGGNAPQFSFLTPRFFSCPPRYFSGGRSCCFWAEKTLKFAISARKSLRISAKTFFFFWKSPAFGRKICDFGQKNAAKTFALPILILPPDLAKLATPLGRWQLDSKTERSLRFLLIKVTW